MDQCRQRHQDSDNHPRPDARPHSVGFPVKRLLIKILVFFRRMVKPENGESQVDYSVDLAVEGLVGATWWVSKKTPIVP